MKLIKGSTLGVLKPYYQSITDLTPDQPYNKIDRISNDVDQNWHNNTQYNIVYINVEK